MKMYVACQFVIAPSFFDPPFWENLRKADVWDSSWPVYAAVYGYTMGGFNTVGNLALVLRLDSAPEPALLALNRLRQSTALGVPDWANEVLDAYESHTREERPRSNGQDLIPPASPAP